MMRGVILHLVASLVVLLVSAGSAAAADAPRTQGRLNNLKVLSDNVDDVTTVENIVRSFAKPGMSDAERSRALWMAVVKYRHQTIPPDEFLAADWEVHDPVKIFNVYGYCMCCCCSALVEALNRADGREARGRILTGHSVPEVRYGDGWHMFDASLINVFPRPGDGGYASVDEVSGAVRDWYTQHPEYRGKPAKLDELMRSEDWMGWKAKGPALLANCPFYKQGFFPAHTHGWNTTMVEYDRKSEVYEYGYHVGHRALLSLRPGESLVREAGNRGLHVNGATMPSWDMLKARAPMNDLAYLTEVFPGYRGGVVANGVQRYEVDLAHGALAEGAERYENLAAGGSPALHVERAGRPGVAIVPMTSPYVYLSGRVKVRSIRPSAEDSVAVSISTNNGRDYTPLWTAPVQAGTADAVIDLSNQIVRRYAYSLQIEIKSNSPTGAGLDRLVIENDIQHAPRTLPWLGEGRTTITVAADGDLHVTSRSFTGRITDDAAFTKNETTRSLGVVFDNLDVRDGSCWWKSGTGTMTVPIEVPGDLVALRYSLQVRARGAKDRIRTLVSRDGGRAWSEVAQISGPTPGTTRTFRFAEWSAGTRKALLRFELTGNNTVGILSFRIDADYRDPLAAPAFHPFEVVHRWTEQGRERTRRERIPRLPYSYTIEAGKEPEMVSVSYEMPPGP